MKLRDFIADSNKFKDEILDKEIVVEAKNGMFFEPKIKFILVDSTNPLLLDSQNIDKLVITHE